MADSPAGQLAWILEKFWAWTDCDGHPENALTRDEMLDNVMLYWVTELGDVVGAPLLGELRTRHRARPSPCRPASPSIPRRSCRRCRSWSNERYPNIVHWREYDKGGHFAAFEVPETFVADLREWARLVR